MSSTDVLRGVPLFQGMTDRSIEAIADLAEPATFDSGDDLVREGEPGDTFLLLVDGTADVTQAGTRIRTLGPGDFLGEISLIDGGLHTATVTATTSIDALAIDRAGFARLMSDWPVVRLDLVAALTQRLRTRAPEPTD